MNLSKCFSVKPRRHEDLNLETNPTFSEICSRISHKVAGMRVFTVDEGENINILDNRTYSRLVVRIQRPIENYLYEFK